MDKMEKGFSNQRGFILSMCKQSPMQKEGNVLFNDTQHIVFIVGIGNMVKDHSDSKRGNLLP